MIILPSICIEWVVYKHIPYNLKYVIPNKSQHSKCLNGENSIALYWDARGKIVLMLMLVTNNILLSITKIQYL